MTRDDSLVLDEIHVNGRDDPGRVHVVFSNIDMNLDIPSARKLAKAMLEQADVSELEVMRL